MAGLTVASLGAYLTYAPQNNFNDIAVATFAGYLLPATIHDWIQETRGMINHEQSFNQRLQKLYSIDQIKFIAIATFFVWSLTHNMPENEKWSIAGYAIPMVFFGVLIRFFALTFPLIDENVL